MDMNRTFFLRSEKHTPKWRVIDAQGQVVGRLATEIADILRGKDTAQYTPHADGGDYVIVVNASKIVFTGNKLKDKKYEWYTGYMGGLKSLTAEQMIDRHPEDILVKAVKGMLPKNKLADAIIKKLKVYAGSEHPHKAQVTPVTNNA